LAMKREVSEEVSQIVRTIGDDVIARGDAAVIELTARFDRLTLTPATLRVSAEEIAQAIAACDIRTLDALKLAAERIR
ncbi:histidinol dehydrogenase, partial [Stenotrophomonas maltophilia]|uniref:histidinol dehydrogenase n=1 Tax=Stenotrophomonas maltophilia TaxID=40324 RepID=UPI0013DA9BBF